MKKGFRNFIGAPRPNLSVEEKSVVVTPDPPENVQVTGINAGADALVTWDPPSNSPSPCLLTEVWVDDVLLGNTSGTSYTFPVTFAVVYSIKLRCRSLFNTPSAYTTPVSYTGGGLPIMQAYGLGLWRKVGIFWDPVEDNASYTIEGYNVYDETAGTPGIKLNASLLPLTTHSYFVAADPLETKTLAVSFEYNTGTESVTYPVTVTADGKPGELWAAIVDNDWAHLVAIEGTPVNLFGPDAYCFRVARGSLVDVSVKDWKPPHGREWTFPSYPELVYEWTLTGAKSFIFTVPVGGEPCGSTERNQTGEGIEDYPVYEKITVQRKNLTAPSFLISGPPCDPSKDDPQETFYISIRGADFRGLERPPDDWGVEFVDMSIPNSSITVNVVGGVAEVSWVGKGSEVDGYNVFYRALGSPDPLVQDNTVTVTDTNYDITGLAAGDYEVSIGYVYGTYYETHEADLRNDPDLFEPFTIP